jgi:adenylosuccinate lyase
MIPRYARQPMVDIWSPQTKFRIWFEIEAHACDAQAELGVIPKEAAEAVWARGGNATFDIDRIDEIERETKHDVIAFLTHLAEIVGPQARLVHQGMTSSDVLDTCLAVQLTAPPTSFWRIWTACSRRSNARPRTQDDRVHRALAWHPRRTGDLRAETRPSLCGV